MSKPKIHTMKELSKAVGISRPTLARYFEDEDSVLPSTAAKIRSRLEEVDYVYNFLATRQNRKSTGLIGVVIPQFKDLFYASLLDSIEMAVREAGFTMIAQCSRGEGGAEVEALRKLRSMNVDGAVVIPVGASGSSEAFALAAKDFPIIFADSKPVEIPENAGIVGTDNLSSIGVMVDYLCRTGEPPVFLAMPKLSSNAGERLEAYFHHMAKHGLEGEVVPTPRNIGSWRFERYGFEVMDDHFNHGRYREATVLCANDRLAIGAIRAANTHRLFGGVGAGISLRIAGHDDHPLSRYTYPSVTTVAQEVEAIGGDAVRLLIEGIRGGGITGAPRKRRGGILRIRESA